MPGQKNCRGDWFLRSTEPTGRAGRGTSARIALLHGALRILEPGCGGGRREKFFGGGGARSLSKWRARDAPAPEQGTWCNDQVLGAAGHRESHQGPPSERSSRDAGETDHAGQTGGRKWSRRAEVARPARLL